MNRLVMLALAMSLAGCSDRHPLRQGDTDAPLDLTLTRPCAAPASIPDRDLSEREVARLWGADRIGLADCRRRQAAAIAIIERRDAALAHP